MSRTRQRLGSQRRRLSDVIGGGSDLYFLSPSKSYTFIHSGASTLDNVLGGGWPLGRVSNVIGDRSTGKTLVAIEAMANFVRQFPKAGVRYAETEAAFDDGYAEALGLPLRKVRRPKKGSIDTVEQFYGDIKEYTSDLDRHGGLYVLDSLDALTDAAELGSDIGKDSYGTGKAKKMSQMFRRIVRRLDSSSCHLMIISQTRDKIGVSFGRKYTRSGGRALDFYASQILYLAHIGEIKRKVDKIQRVVGVDIKVKCTKNKIGLPFRGCGFPILFGYGIEDTCASIDWLIENGKSKLTNLTLKELKGMRKSAINGRLEDSAEKRELLASCVDLGWKQIERSFLPTKRKYE